MQPHFIQGLIAISALGLVTGALPVGFMAWAQAQSGQTKRTMILWSVGFAAILALLIPGEFWFLAGVTDPAFPIWKVAALSASIFFFGLLPIPLVSRGQRKRAATRIAHAHSISQWTLANFDSLVGREPGFGEGVITEGTLSLALMSAELPEDARKAISAIRSSLSSIGHKIAEERSFAVTVDKQVEETPVTRDVIGISRADIESWESRITETNRTWLPRA